jgi:hypothetical protein
MALLKSWDQNAEDHTCRISCPFVYSAGLLWAASLTMQPAVNARLHPQYYPERAETCQLFLQHLLLRHFLISFMLLTDEVGYSWWYHKLPESPSLSRCQFTWNCSITKLPMIFSKYVGGHNSRHIHTSSSFHLSACNSAWDAQVPLCGTMGTVLGVYWNQFTNKHYSMNRHILFLCTSTMKWAMLADTFCSIQNTCQKSGTVYFRNILCVWCDIWQ